MAKTELSSVLNYHLVAFVIDSVTFLGVTSYIMTREHLRLTKELAEAGESVKPIEHVSAFELLIYPLTIVSPNFGEERYELLRSGAVLCMNLLSQLIIYVSFRKAAEQDTDPDSDAAGEARHPWSRRGLPTISVEDIAKMAQEQLESGTYAELSKQCKHAGPVPTSCCICLNDFEKHDEATVLNCDARHIFHADCILKAFQTKLACPICRKPALCDSHSTRHTHHHYQPLATAEAP